MALRSDLTALVADDHPLVRQAMEFLLRDRLGFGNVLAVPSIETAIEVAGPLQTLNLAILDLSMPGLSGAAGVEAFCSAFPDTMVVVLSGIDDRTTIAAALSAGARIFIPKSAPPEDIGRKLREVMAKGDPDIRLDPVITPRQREVLLGLARGLSTKEICREIGLAESTVKIHLVGLFRRLGVGNRTEAALAARRLGLAAEG